MTERSNVVELRDDLTPQYARRLRDYLRTELHKPVWSDDRHLVNDLAALAHKINQTALLAGAVSPVAQRTEPGEYSDVDQVIAQLYSDVEQLLFKATEYDYNARRAAAVKREAKKRAKRLVAKKLVG